METLLHVGLSNAVAALILAVLALGVSLCCRRRPALVHGLWLLVLLKLVTPPLVRVPVPWPDGRGGAATDRGPESPPAPEPGPPGDAPDEALVFPPPGIEEGDKADAPLEGPVAAAEVPAAPAWDWTAWALGVWLSGSVVWFALAATRLFRFRRLLRHAAPAPPALRDRARRLARRIGLGDGPAVWLVPGRLPPMIWAAGGAARLVLPADLAGRVDERQLETLLLHELAHLRRRDHWVRWLELVCLGLYWWHPVVWLARRELREAEEQCCDAWVVSSLPGAGRAYALALVETLDFLSEARPAVPALASGIGQVADLKRRLTMILCGTTPRALGWRGALVVFGLGGLLLPALPAWGQDKKADEKRIEAEEDPPVHRIRVHLDDGDVRLHLDATADEVKKLQDEIARRRKELEAYEAKLKDLLHKTKVETDQAAAKAALEKLARELHAQVEKTKTAAGDRWVVVGQGKEGGIHLRLVPKDVKAGSPVVELMLSKKDGKWVVQEVKGAEWKADGKVGPPGETIRLWDLKTGRDVTPRPKTEADARLERLEKVIQSLQAEVDTLRRELKRSGTAEPDVKPKPMPKPGEPRTDKPTEEGKIRLQIDEFKRAQGEVLKRAKDKEAAIEAKLREEIEILRAKIAELEKARGAKPEPPTPPTPPRPR